jgi:hypothetical protein
MRVVNGVVLFRSIVSVCNGQLLLKDFNFTFIAVSKYYFSHPQSMV